MFEEYRRKVFDNYKTKQNLRLLSPNLNNPSPAKLKAECLLKLSSTILKNDERTLSTFFEKEFDLNNFHSVISHFDSDKFRPLNNFLKDRIEKPDDKNIELLAWLIDFENRPYRIRDYTNPNTEPEDITTTLPQIPTEETTDKPSKETPPKTEKNPDINWFNTFNKNFAIGGLVVIAVAIVALVLTQKLEKQCMYWKTDHYVEVACDEKPKSSIAIVALDTAKVNNLKKILTPDTLTLNDIGKVWYSKIANDSIEFYTASGKHPTLHGKNLKPATEYIINKYVFNKKVIE